ncbi:MAG: ribose-phosphate diphosphokinase [Candidatus Altiarchaeota archaeon]
MLVFGSSNSEDLAWEVSKNLNAGLGKLEVQKFPDGELYVRVDSDVKGEELAVIKRTRTSDDLIELILTLDALRDSGARLIHTVLPYMIYSRQDKRFKKGEALSAKTLLKVLDELSDDITTVNCHFLRESDERVYHSVRIRNLDAIPQIVDYFRDKIRRPLVIAPDKGSMPYAQEAAELLDCEFNHLQKKRVSGKEVIIKSKELDVTRNDILILDDMISTGGTIAEAAKVIRGWKPQSINVGCVHGLFLNGIEQFKGTVDRLVCTNTLQTPISKVSVSDIIAGDLKR